MPLINTLEKESRRRELAACDRLWTIHLRVSSRNWPSNKTVAGIAREVPPAESKRALNKFLIEYVWDEE